MTSFHRIGKTECKEEDFIKSDVDEYDASEQISSKYDLGEPVFLDDITL